MIYELLKLYNVIYCVSSSYLTELSQVNFDKFFDKEFYPHNKNRSNILFFYTVIKRNREEFKKVGFSYDTCKYGINDSMNMPFLYDNNYEILFFTINNDLNTDVIKKHLTEASSNKKNLVVVSFDIEDQNITLYEKTFVNKCWKCEKIIFKN